MEYGPNIIPRVLADHQQLRYLTVAPFGVVAERETYVKKNDTWFFRAFLVWAGAILVLGGLTSFSGMPGTNKFGIIMMLVLASSISMVVFMVRLQIFRKTAYRFQKDHLLKTLGHLDGEAILWAERTEEVATSIHGRLVSLSDQGVARPEELDESHTVLNKLVRLLARDWMPGHEERCAELHGQLEKVDARLAEVGAALR